jgi:5-deoxy-D-glucuronate isomerase
MKKQHKISVYIACLAIICGLSGCKKPVEQKEVTVDVVVSSDFESSILSDELQSLYLPSEVFVDKEQRTMFVPTGKLSRIDLKTPTELSVQYTPTALEKIQRQLKKPTEEDIQKGIKQYLSKVDVSSLNSKETVDKDTKINRIKEFITQQQGDATKYAAVLFYSSNLNITLWNNNSVYHSIDSISAVVFGMVSSSPKSKFLVVYNPPIFNKEITSSDTLIEKEVEEKLYLSLDVTKKEITKGENFTLTINTNIADKDLKWQSSNPNIVSVDNKGKISANKPGTATVSVSTPDGQISVSCVIVVKGGGSSGGGTTPTKTYSFGKYVGSLQNGIPEGDGTMTYTRRVQIAKHDTQNPAHWAEAGDKFVGSWGNGDIVSGALYDRNGVIKERILAPKRFNPYNLSND